MAEADVEELADAVADRVVERLAARAAAADRLLDVRGVADHLGVSVRTVEAVVADGDLVPIRVRGARRFSPQAVEAYLRRAAGTRRRRRTT